MFHREHMSTGSPTLVTKVTSLRLLRLGLSGRRMDLGADEGQRPAQQGLHCCRGTSASLRTEARQAAGTAAWQGCAKEPPPWD